MTDNSNRKKVRIGQDGTIYVDGSNNDANRANTPASSPNGGDHPNRDSGRMTLTVCAAIIVLGLLGAIVSAKSSQDNKQSYSSDSSRPTHASPSPSSDAESPSSSSSSSSSTSYSDTRDSSSSSDTVSSGPSYSDTTSSSSPSSSNTTSSNSGTTDSSSSQGTSGNTATTCKKTSRGTYVLSGRVHAHQESVYEQSISVVSMTLDAPIDYSYEHKGTAYDTAKEVELETSLSSSYGQWTPYDGKHITVECDGLHEAIRDASMHGVDALATGDIRLLSD